MNGIDAVQQVFAELSVVYHFIQVAVGGTNQSDIGRLRGVASHLDEIPFLKYRKQFGLQVIRKVGNFIEKQRSAVGCLKTPDTVGMGIGKRTFDVTKQFTFKQ